VDIDGKAMPMTISKSYTLSMHEKASLRRDLGAWRGKPFTEEEAAEFDVSKLVGAYCMLNVTHSETNGKTYSNVTGITPLPGALKNAKPAPVHANVMFDLDQPDMAVFEAFHEKLQDYIKRSPEWAKATGQKAPAKAAASVDEEDYSDVPF
jgi:CO dehydrogenase/acetyl-CoA synthase delta subunit